jgi:hypothetical protein
MEAPEKTPGASHVLQVLSVGMSSDKFPELTLSEVGVELPGSILF